MRIECAAASAEGSSWIPPSSDAERDGGGARQQLPPAPRLAGAEQRRTPRAPAAFHQTACGNPSRNSDARITAIAANASVRARRRSSTISTSAAASSQGMCATTATMLMWWWCSRLKPLNANSIAPKSAAAWLNRRRRRNQNIPANAAG